MPGYSKTLRSVLFYLDMHTYNVLISDEIRRIMVMRFRRAREALNRAKARRGNDPSVNDTMIDDFLRQNPREWP